MGCGKLGTYLCTECFLSVKPHFPQVCAVCEKPSIEGYTHPRCKTIYTPGRFLAVWKYEGTIKKLIHKLKYKFVSDVASELALKIGEFIKTNNLEKSILVPIPLFKTRENWRGFNHTGEVGKRIAGQLGWGYREILEKIRDTRTQVGLSEKDRKINIKDAFMVKKRIKVEQNKTILLFDDIWTSGSTLKEAVRTLKKMGYTRVVCLTIAR